MKLQKRLTLENGCVQLITHKFADLDLKYLDDQKCMAVTNISVPEEE